MNPKKDSTGWSLNVCGKEGKTLATYRGFHYTRVSWSPIHTDIGEMKELVIDLDDRTKDEPDIEKISNEDKIDAIYMMCKRICEKLNVEV